MIRVIVMYPNETNARFDHPYYRDKHMALVKERLGDMCKTCEVDLGVSGVAPGAAPTYLAIGYLTFDSMTDFQSAFAPHAHEFMADVPNFTNVAPVVQINEILLR